MDKLEIKGVQNINGKKVRVIEGGFGKGQKAMLLSDIAVQHEVELRTLNVLVNNNIKRFNENDLIDFLNPSEGFRDFAKENGLITSNRTKNIFVLSERGYSKLVAMMENSNDKKWETMDKLIDEYFTMREIINSEEQFVANLLLKIYEGGQEGVVASKQLTEIEVKKATAPLLGTIAEQQPKVAYFDDLVEKNLLTNFRDTAKELKIGQNEFIKWLTEKGYIYRDKKNQIKPKANHTPDLFELKEWVRGSKSGVQTLITPKGRETFRLLLEVRN